MTPYFVVLKLSCVLLFVCLVQTNAYAEKQPAVANKVYIINLASSLKSFNPTHLPRLDAANVSRFYTVRFKYKNQVWNRLRLGFFNSKNQAEKILTDVRKTYPEAFIGVVSVNEIEQSKKAEIARGVYSVEHLLVSAADVMIDAASAIKLRSENESSAQNSTRQTPIVDTYFVASLKTAANLSEFDSISSHALISKQALYLSELEVDNRIWYQYRVGFFTSEDEANRLINAVSSEFPLARLIRISWQEKMVATSRIRDFTAAAGPREKIMPKQKPATNPDQVYDALVKKGTRALSKKNYQTAVLAFSELLSYPENRFSMDAQELLGFAYELSGKIANARNEYERYISLYPESSGAIRVKQRLASLITARKAAPKELRQARKDQIKPQWENYGSISQFYRRDTSTIDVNTETSVTTINTTDKRVNLSVIDTVLNLNSRRRSNDFDIRTRFTGGHSYDFLNESASNKAPVNEAYVDVLDIHNKINGRLGRQSSSKGGVLGRFDGIDAGYQVSDWLKLNITTGYQVASVYHSADSDSLFAGVSADLGTFFNAWDFSLYYIKQNEGDIVGREAVGTEFRYFHPRRSLFGLVDYDIMFDVINTFLINGTWILPNNTSVNATIDIRQSPLLTVKNALQGQTFASIDEMLGSFSEQEILQIAEDRTAKVETLIVGVSHPLADDYTLNADLTATRISATTASAGVEAIPGTDLDYFFHTQLVGSSVFYPNDTNITGLSYSETSASDTLSLLWNYRIPVSREFRLNPRLTLARRDNSNDTSQSIYGIRFKMDYRWSRNTSFEFEFGGEVSDRTLVTGDEQNKVYFLNLGYQHSF